MKGYWEAPVETARTIDESGWLHTGDLAVFDEEFVCRIVGREKEMINRGGEKISPVDVESFLMRHPKIMDVAVFGVSDSKFGEQIAAWIKLHEGQTADADEIRDFCRNQIAHYKIPTHISFVTEFPMTQNGKLQRFVVRERMERELGLNG
jgi:fatty-acyl-CoA synthase